MTEIRYPVSANDDPALRKRKRGLVLTMVLSVAYFGFVFMVAFEPDLTRRPVAGVISLGLVLGVAEIVFAVLITGFYVFQTNADDRAGDVGDQT